MQNYTLSVIYELRNHDGLLLIHCWSLNLWFDIIEFEYSWTWKEFYNIGL